MSLQDELRLGTFIDGLYDACVRQEARETLAATNSKSPTAQANVEVKTMRRTEKSVVTTYIVRSAIKKTTQGRPSPTASVKHEEPDALEKFDFDAEMFLMCVATTTLKARQLAPKCALAARGCVCRLRTRSR